MFKYALTALCPDNVIYAGVGFGGYALNGRIKGIYFYLLLQSDCLGM